MSFIERIKRYIRRRVSIPRFRSEFKNDSYQNSYINNIIAGMKVGKGTKIDSRAYFIHGNLIEIGKGCDIEAYATFMTQSSSIKIGDDVLIAPHACFIGDNMDSRGKNKIKDRPNISSEGIIVENECWIGINAVILPGVRIGMGSVVAAGSVVTKDVPEYTIVAGVPASVVRKRD